MVKQRTIGSGDRALKHHGSIEQPEQHSRPEQPEQQDQQQQQQSQLDQVPSAVITAGISVKSKQDVKRVSHKKLLSEEKLKRLKEQHDRRGIVYISRLPPHMKPGKLRQLLSQYGELGRLYCTPEDQAARRQRKQKGGNSGKNFTEGWVEFQDKAVAKQVAVALNGQQMGGKRRSAYHFDLWAMKYLPKFKWDHLTEEIAYEKAVREQRMAQELSAAKRERDFYMSRVDKAKAIAAMEQRQQAKQQQHEVAACDEISNVEPAAAAAGGTAAGATDDSRGNAAAKANGIKRMYGQRKVKGAPSLLGAAEVQDELLQLIVSKKRRGLST